MERLKSWLKEHWKPVAIVAAAVVGIYLVLRNRAAGAGSAAAGGGLPQTGAAPLGNMTPFSPQESLAYRKASQLLTSQQQMSAAGLPLLNMVPGAQLTGVVKERWEQATFGGETIWEDISGQHRNAITDVQAHDPSLTRHGYGPFATGGGGTLNKVISYIKQAAALYAESQGVPISSQEAQGFANTDIGQQPAPSSGAVNGPFLPAPYANAAPYSGTATTANMQPPPPISY